MSDLKKLSILELDALYAFTHRCEHMIPQDQGGLFIDPVSGDCRDKILKEVRARMEAYINPVEKPIKKEPEIEADVMKDIIYYFSKIRNEYKLGNRPLKLTYSRKREIQARLNEGYNLDDFKAAIKSRIIAWNLDKEMRQYCTPETIFRASNFPKYVEQAESILKQQKTDWTEANEEQGKNTSEMDW